MENTSSFPPAMSFSEFAQEKVCILPADGLRPRFDRERLREFSHSQPGSPDKIAWSIDDQINSRCAGLRVVELNERAGIEEVASQRSTFPSVGDNFGCH